MIITGTMTNLLKEQTCITISSEKNVFRKFIQNPLDRNCITFLKSANLRGTSKAFFEMVERSYPKCLIPREIFSRQHIGYCLSTIILIRSSHLMHQECEQNFSEDQYISRTDRRFLQHLTQHLIIT